MSDALLLLLDQKLRITDNVDERTCRISSARLSSDSGTGFFYRTRSGVAIFFEEREMPSKLSPLNNDGMQARDKRSLRGIAKQVEIFENTLRNLVDSARGAAASMKRDVIKDLVSSIR